MADVKISALPALGTAPDPNDIIPIVHSGVTNTITVMELFTNPLLDQYADFYQSSLDPAAPSTSSARIYAKPIAGKMTPKWIGPSGLDQPFQGALYGNNVVMFSASGGTTGTGNPIGTLWKSNGTVSHPAPSSTSPAITNQMHRTRYANVITTTNQQLGPIISAADGAQFWIGNSATTGGFFFFARFTLELWVTTGCRLFVGLASGTTSVAISDTVAGDVCGLWHDTTDSNTTLNFVTRDNSTTTKTAITVNALAAGKSYDFYMFIPPGTGGLGGSISYRLDDIVAGTTVVDAVAGTSPRITAFMGPQCQMSNGTANITATTVAIGVNRIYIESDH